MYPYLICFLITILLAYANEKYLRKHENNNKKSNVSKVLLAALVILPPAILAGLRDYVVGTDVMVYAYQVFGIANNIHGIADLFSPNIYNSRIEIGFYILAWFSHIFSDDAHIFLFFISLFIGVFVYLILYRMREFVSIWLGEAVYLLCFYNETLNMMRQSMAIVMVIYAFTFIYYKKSWSKFWILAIPSYFFHHSAVIGLSLFLPVLIFGKDKINSKKSWKYMALILLIFLGFLLIASNFVAVFSSQFFDIFSDQLAGFVSNYSTNTGDTGLTPFILYFFPYLLLCIRFKHIKYGYMYLCIALIDAAFYSVRAGYPFIYRLFAYYYWFRLLSFSSIPINLNKTIISNRTYKILLLTTLFLYWQFTFGGNIKSNEMHGAHETMPYKSEIINIR